MKKNSNDLLGQISTSQFQQLTHMVKETIAQGLYKPANKIFTAADLWSIHRQGKTRTQRRFSF